ncbi:hypothetical protein [Protaetiibacter mangrovi]|uniref:Uncharacterized protein n=1 Tax=Protaetiibacter mangrovi TaxID=2970926 RepID=A0ABT1ZDU2_9MICO|nr:hypothetical protein [Protaetiibacter mangrovi]MCS0498856.1 hypothetical protein [Protaetiibacter mangrovi]TPX05112.1 hypothetical protein FJ656_08275 [Schumannella luteola]
MRRLFALAALAAATLALTGCGIVAPEPHPTTTGLAIGGDGQVDGADDGGDGGDGGDPFPPEIPTTLDGWTARYQNLPWLADDLDNDDFFITGTVDGHSVMGFLCGYDGEPQGWALGTDGTYVEVEFQSDVDIDLTAMRAEPYITLQAIGGYAIPAEAQGSHEVVPALATNEVDSDPTHDVRSTPTNASVTFEFLGVPTPDPDACDRESSSLQGWVYAEFGY